MIRYQKDESKFSPVGAIYRNGRLPKDKVWWWRKRQQAAVVGLNLNLLLKTPPSRGGD